MSLLPLPQWIDAQYSAASFVSYQAWEAGLKPGLCTTPCLLPPERLLGTLAHKMGTLTRDRLNWNKPHRGKKELLLVWSSREYMPLWVRVMRQLAASPHTGSPEMTAGGAAQLLLPRCLAAAAERRCGLLRGRSGPTPQATGRRRT